MFVDRQLYDVEREERTPLKVNRESEAYMRMAAAGFKIREAYKLQRTTVSPTFDNSEYRVEFECVCGRIEILSQWADESIPALHVQYKAPRGWDAALDIERAGAVDEKHLREDGFSETDIRRIRYVYDLYEEVNSLRALTGINYKARKEEARAQH